MNLSNLQSPILLNSEYSNTEQIQEKLNNFYSKKRQIFQHQNQYQRVTSQPYVSPKLPQQKKQNQYTLVLDIDETLLHTDYQPKTDSYEVTLRPYALQFLQVMSTFFEIVTFTAGTQEYGDEVIDNYLDPKNEYISHRLYRQHCKWYTDSQSNYEQFCIKDLLSLGRDLSKTIILDNIGDNFNFLQPFNGIEVLSYYQGYDQVLKDLIQPLQNLVQKGLDVRNFIYTQIKSYDINSIDEILKMILVRSNNNKRKSQQNNGQNQVLLKRKRKSKPDPIITQEMLKQILFIFIIVAVKMSYCTLYAFNKFCYCINEATLNKPTTNILKIKQKLTPQPSPQLQQNAISDYQQQFLPKNVEFNEYQRNLGSNLMKIQS